MVMANMENVPKKKVRLSEREKDMLTLNIDGVDMRDYPILRKFSSSINRESHDLLGRDTLILAIQEALARPLMHNIILTGPAGVGKTALVGGYGKLPSMKRSLILFVSLPTMAGDGDNKFAERIHSFVEESIILLDQLQRLDLYDELILFMDELHLLTMNGKGGRAGGSAAGNALKPLLARGAIKLIGATTDEEFVRYIRPDAALTRRFQNINVPEPDTDTCIEILKNIAHGILGDRYYEVIPDETILWEMVDVTDRYVPSRAQPAKSIDMLDSALGVYNITKGVINHALLAQLMMIQHNTDIDWHTDIRTVVDKLRQRVRGQDHVINMIKSRLYIANAKLQDDSRPLADFLFVGPTGVGKTELVKGMAEAMFGREDAMIRFDMSEFQGDDDVHPFQVQISEAISKKPYAVVLLDEFEKANRGIMNLMLAILDDGRLSDEYGRQVTFTNAIIVLTSNAAADAFRDIKKQGASLEEADNLLRDELGGVFTPEFLGRFDEVVPFSGLKAEDFLEIAKIQLAQQVTKMQKRYHVQVGFDQRVAQYLVYEQFKALRDTAAGGGRAMKQRIMREIVTLFSRVVDVIVSAPELELSNLVSIKIYVQGTLRREDISLKVGTAFLEADFLMRDGQIGIITDRDEKVIYTNVNEVAAVRGTL